METTNAIAFTRAHHCAKFSFEEKQFFQEEKILNACKINNIKLLKIVKCNSILFKKNGWIFYLIKEIEKNSNKVNIIAFSSWDRLTRDASCSELDNLFNYCDNNKIKLWCINQML